MANKFKENNFFIDKLRRTRAFFEFANDNEIDLMQINVKQAFLQSDIKWENLQKNRNYAYFKRISLFILLVLFSVLILSPINAINTLEPMRIALEKIVSKLSFA